MKHLKFNARLLSRGVFSLVLAAPLISFAQSLAWTARYDGGLGLNEDNYWGAFDSKQNVVMCVATDAPLPALTAVKYDPSGHLLWSRSIMGTDLTQTAWENKAMVDSQDNVIIVGSIPLIGDGLDYCVAKFDKNGNQLWVKTFDASSHSDDYIYGATIDNSNNVIVTGYAVEGAFNCITIKYSPTGTVLWTDKLNSQGYTASGGDSVGTDQFGNVYPACDGYPGTSTDEFIVTKMDPNGVHLWTNVWNGPGNLDDFPYSLVVTPTGRCVATGVTDSPITGFDIVTRSYDSNGNNQWTQIFSGAAADYGFWAAIDNSGNVAVGGETITHGGFTEGLILHYDVSGTQDWSALVYNPHYTLASQVAGGSFDAAGNFYSSSLVWDGVAHGNDISVSKWSPSGVELWKQVYDSPTHNDEITGIAMVDSQGSVYIPGTGGSVNNGSDALLVKYEPATRIPVTAFSLFRGTFVSGNVASLQDSDDNRVTAQKGFVANLSEAPIQYVLTGTAPTGTTSQINVTVESGVSTANLKQRIELFDWTTNAYVNIDERPASTSDSVTAIAVTTNASHFVETTTKQVKAKVSYIAVGFVAQASWKANLDQVFFGQM